MTKYEHQLNLIYKIKELKRRFNDFDLKLFYFNALEGAKKKLLNMTVEEAELEVTLLG